MRIRQFEREDLWAVLAIQEKCPQAAKWLEADYLRLAEKPGGMVLVAELETMTPPKVLGLAAFARIIDEAEVLNLAVDPEHQHQGIGRALIEAARQRLLESGAKKIYLEVRVSNRPALALYYLVGFGLHSLRKDYYREPTEDGYVLCLPLFPPETVASAP